MGIVLSPVLTFAYGSNILIGGSCSASHTDEACDDAFDNNDATYWISNASYPQTITYDLGSGNVGIAGQTVLRVYGDSNGSYIKNFVLQGSNNGSSFVDIYSGITINHTTTQDNIYNIDDTNTYRYFRIKVNDSWASEIVLTNWMLSCPDSGCSGGGGGGGGGTGTTTLIDLANTATSTYATTTGFSITDAVDWGVHDLVGVYIGTVFNSLYVWRYWLSSGLAILMILGFAFRGLYFFRN